MTDKSTSALVALEQEGPDSTDAVLDTESASVSEARRRRIRLFSRIGLWSLVVGMVPVAESVLSSTWLWTVEPGFSLPSLGFIIGGVGIATSAVLALRELGRRIRPVKIAALAAVPFGLALVLLGSMHLSAPWLAPTEFSVSVFHLVFRGAGLLAAVVVAMLAVAFVTSIGDDQRGDAL